MPGGGGQSPPCVLAQLTTSNRDDLPNTVRAGTTMAIAWAAASKMIMTTYMAVPRTSVIPGESMRISKSLWAVAVPAAAVARPLVAAAIAAFEMTAESCGATHLDRGHDTPLCR